MCQSVTGFCFLDQSPAFLHLPARLKEAVKRKKIGEEEEEEEEREGERQTERERERERDKGKKKEATNRSSKGKAFVAKALDMHPFDCFERKVTPATLTFTHLLCYFCGWPFVTFKLA